MSNIHIHLSLVYKYIFFLAPDVGRNTVKLSPFRMSMMLHVKNSEVKLNCLEMVVAISPDQSLFRTENNPYF